MQRKAKFANFLPALMPMVLYSPVASSESVDAIPSIPPSTASYVSVTQMCSVLATPSM
ncbi:hypothetical protein JCM11754A_23690 [Isoptericola variabilis]